MKEGWEIKQLKDVIIAIKDGGTPSRTKPEYFGGDISWCVVKDIQSEIYSTKETLTELGLSKCSARIWPINSVIISLGATIGQVGITRIPVATKQGISGIVLNETILIPEFLVYFLNFKKEFIQKAASGTTIKEVRPSKLAEILQIPLPSIPEQQRIVSIIDKAFEAIDKAIENTQKNLQNAKDLFESYLNSVFENGGEGWVEKKLDEIASFRNGINFTKSSKGEEIKIVGVRDFQNNFWIPFNDLESVILDGVLQEIDKLKEYDILTVRSNGNPALIGRTLLATEVEGKISHSGFTIRIRLNNLNIVLPALLCRYLKTQKTRQQLIEQGNGIGIKSLNQGSLSSLIIPFPNSIDDQHAIINKINALQTEMQKSELAYRRKLDKLVELKKSVLNKAFAGEL